MIYNFSVDFLGNAQVKTTISCLHVKDRDLLPLGRQDRQAAVGVSKNEKCIRSIRVQQVVHLYNHVRYRLYRRSCCRFQEMIWTADTKIPKEYLVQFKIIILACMYHAVISELIEFGNGT